MLPESEWDVDSLIEPSSLLEFELLMLTDSEIDSELDVLSEVDVEPLSEAESLLELFPDSEIDTESLLETDSDIDRESEAESLSE